MVKGVEMDDKKLSIIALICAVIAAFATIARLVLALQ